MQKRFHPDWPVVDTDLAEKYRLPEPVDDMAYALEVAMPLRRSPEEPRRTITISDVAEVTHYHVEHHGIPWTPSGSPGGTELSMYLLGRLETGEWFYLEAWNDYTGWGCQDGADLVIRPSREEILTEMTDEGRRRLFTIPGETAPKEIS